VGVSSREEGELGELRTFVLPLLTVAILGLIGVGILTMQQQREADRAVHANQLVHEIALGTNRLGSLGEEAVDDQRVSPSLGRQVDRTSENVANLVDQLADTDPDGDRGEMEEPFAEFTTALSEELHLVRLGRIADAREAATSRVSPAFAEINEVVEEELGEHREIARDELAKAHRANLLALGAGGVVVLILAWLFLLNRRAVLREREYVEELRELDKLKDALLATVSHELRTPLTSITGYLELLRLDGSGTLSKSQEQMLEVVDRNAHRLTRLVGDLLFVASLEEGAANLSLEDLDLSEVARESVEAVVPQADRAGIEVVLELQDWLPICGDRGRLSQLVDNLVSNAVKFTPPGGRIAVRALARNDKAVLEVADTGIGISPSDREQIFEPFFRSEVTARHAIQGAGLGLAIVKMIVEAHEATLSVESEEGAGTTFRVEFQRLKSRTRAPLESVAAPS
jgi:signal transduction histidine kinase